MYRFCFICFYDLAKFSDRLLERFLNAVGCIDCCFVSDETLEQVPQPAKVGQTKVGGIDLNQTRMRRVAEAILALSTAPPGFTASELAGKVRDIIGEAQPQYGPRRL